MTNPQLTKNLLVVIRSLPDEDRRWLLEQLGEDNADLSNQELAERSRSEAGRGLKPWTRLTTPGFCICDVTPFTGPVPMRAGGCGQAAFHCWRTSRGVRPWRAECGL